MTALASFLDSHAVYDILPVSLKVVVIDSALPLKKAVAALLLNGIVAAPTWQNETSRFFGLLTAHDLLQLVLQLAQKKDVPFDQLVDEIDSMNVQQLREGSQGCLNPTHIDPLETLLTASQIMVQSRIHHLPLIDAKNGGPSMIVSVLSAFKVLKFLACNCPSVRFLTTSIQDSKIGTFHDLKVIKSGSPVMEAIQLLSQANLSALPVVDDQWRLVDVFTEMDVLVRVCSPGGEAAPINVVSLAYLPIQFTVRDFPVTSIWISISDALDRRPADFEEVHTCRQSDSLASLFAAIGKSKVSRFIVIDDEGRVLGIVSLGDLLEFVMSDRVLPLQ